MGFFGLLFSGTPGQQYQTFDDHLELGAFFAFPGFPAVLMQASLQENGAPFFEVVASHFGRAAVSGAINERNLLRQFAVAVAVGAIDGDAEVGHYAARRQVARVGVGGKVPQ